MLPGRDLKNIDTLYRHARIFIDTQEWDSVYYYGQKSLEMALEQENVKIQIYSHFLIGFIHNIKKEYGYGLISYLKAAELAEFSEDKSFNTTLLWLYKSIALTMADYSHFDFAHQYFNKALKLANSTQDTLEVLDVNYRRCNLLIKEKRFEEAEKLCNEILESPALGSYLRIQTQLSRAMVYHEQKKISQARSEYWEVLNAPEADASQISTASYNNSLTYYDSGDYEKAIEELINTIPLCEKDPKLYYLFFTLQYLGRCYEKLNKPNEALGAYLQALPHKSNYGSGAEAYKIYKEIGNIYTFLNDAENAAYYNSIYATELEKHIQEQEEFAIQDKRYNMQLLTEKYFDNIRVREAEQKMAAYTRTTIVVASVLLLLLAGGFYMRQRATKLALAKEISAILRNSKV